MSLSARRQRVQDIAALLAKHAVGPRSVAVLAGAYLRTLQSTTSRREIRLRIRMKASVFDVHMRQSDVFVLEEMLLQQAYELRTELPNDAVIIDAGANIGLATLWLKALCPDASVHAFEPEPTNYRLLSANAAGLRGVCVNPVAVGAANTRVTLHLAGHGALHSTVAADADDRGSLQVECIRLGDYLDAHALKRVDLLKIDVEGSELDVLRGLGDRLTSVRTIVGEMHERLVDEAAFYGLLEAHGFRRLRREYHGTGHRDGVHVFEATRAGV